MSNDYLWDRSGPPDPGVEKLEKMLGSLRHQGTPPEFQMPVRQMPRRPVRRWVALAAAAAVLLAVSLWWDPLPREAPWLAVARIEGAPRVDAKAIPGTGKLAVGTYLETDATSRARIDVGLIGEVDVHPNSRIGLLRTAPTEHRLALDRGKLRARIWAPPGLFFVETPSATAIDLGCVYTLEVDDHGAGELRVESGWVSFEYQGREAFVPEGAMCLTRPGIGPGTPFNANASAPLRQALQKLDFESAGAAPGSPATLEALGVILQEARKEDVVTLWHLLVRAQGDARGRLYDRLAELKPPPQGVTREGILRGDREMLDAWWKAIDLRPSSWWRMWKTGWPPRVK